MFSPPAPIDRDVDCLAANLSALRQRSGRDWHLGTPLLPAAARACEAPADAEARLAASLHGQVPAAVFVIGSGGGAILDAIEAVNPAAEVVLIEPDPGWAEQLLSARDWSGWILTGRLTLLVGPDFAGASGAWRPEQLPRRLPVLILPALARLLPDDTHTAERLVQQLIEDARANAEARRTHATRYLLHTLANAPRIAREGDVASLFGAFAKVPAVIVGAGPSLDGRLPELAAVADRVLIVACAAAARPLLLSGIAPHFIVAVDPSETNGAHLVGLPGGRRPWLVAEGSLFPTALAAFEGRTFFFNVSDHHPWPWLASLGVSRGRLAAWGSGASSALDFALRLGCGPILFAGMDFAFTGGRPYCRGTTFESQWALALSSGQSFDSLCHQAINRWPAAFEHDAEGHLVRTAAHLVSFRNWIRQRIEASPRVRFKQVTPGGILHHPCIEQTSFEDGLAEFGSLQARHIDAQIRHHHRQSPSLTGRLLTGIDRLLEGALGEDDPRPRWLEFAGRSVRAELFAAALRSHEYEAWVEARQSPVTTHQSPVGVASRLATD